jgi:hypothetical protein
VAVGFAAALYQTEGRHFAVDSYLLKKRCLQKEILHTIGNFSRVPNDQQFACGFQNSLPLHLYHEITKAATIRRIITKSLKQQQSAA